MLVSVVIPSYNHEKFIVECIDSVLKQSYTNLELIIIDDGSKDSSVSIIEAYDDQRVFLHTQENQGAHAAINRGLALCKGELITILNSDDVFHVERLAEIVKEFNETDCDFVSSWIDVVNDKSKKLGTKEGWRNMLPWKYKSIDKTFNVTDDYKLNALMTNFVSTTSNMVFRRKVYEEIGGMRNLRFTHDWDFLLRVCEKYKCHEIKKPLLNYRIHGNNTISSSREWMLFEIFWIYAANINRYTSSIIFQSDKNEDLAKDFEKLYESMNFQGNDHVVWTLMSFINGLKQQGVEEPELILLEDKEFRDMIISKIKA